MNVKNSINVYQCAKSYERHFYIKMNPVRLSKESNYCRLFSNNLSLFTQPINTNTLHQILYIFLSIFKHAVPIVGASFRYQLIMIRPIVKPMASYLHDLRTQATIFSSFLLEACTDQGIPQQSRKTCKSNNKVILVGTNRNG